MNWKSRKLWIGISLFVIFFVLFTTLIGFTFVSTSKDVYEQGEKVKISWTDFKLLRSSCGKRVKIYQKSNSDWEKVNRYVINFGSQICVDGELRGGAYPCDVVTFEFLKEPYRTGTETWNSKFYEYKGEEVCKIPPRNPRIPGSSFHWSNETYPSYEIKEVPPGEYKVKYGYAEEKFSIE